MAGKKTLKVPRSDRVPTRDGPGPDSGPGRTEVKRSHLNKAFAVHNRTSYKDEGE